MRDAVASTDEGTLLRIELSPSASEDAFPSGYNRWRGTLEARVQAPPEDGEANNALLALVANRFDVPGDAVGIKNGHTSTRKTLLLRGVSPSQARSTLETVLPP